MSSYPTITLGAEYLRDEYEVTLPKNPMAWISHMVILVFCDTEEAAIFDPVAAHIKQEPLRIITKEKLSYYRTYSIVPRGMACFQRSSGVIEDYIKVVQ